MLPIPKAMLHVLATILPAIATLPLAVLLTEKGGSCYCCCAPLDRKGGMEQQITYLTVSSVVISTSSPTSAFRFATISILPTTVRFTPSPPLVSPPHLRYVLLVRSLIVTLVVHDLFHHPTPLHLFLDLPRVFSKICS